MSKAPSFLKPFLGKSWAFFQSNRILCSNARCSAFFNVWVRGQICPRITVFSAISICCWSQQAWLHRALRQFCSTADARRSPLQLHTSKELYPAAKCIVVRSSIPLPSVPEKERKCSFSEGPSGARPTSPTPYCFQVMMQLSPPLYSLMLKKR